MNSWHVLDFYILYRVHISYYILYYILSVWNHIVLHADPYIYALCIQALGSCIDHYCDLPLTPAYERQQLIQTMLQSNGKEQENLGSPLDDPHPDASSALPSWEHQQVAARQQLVAQKREENLKQEMLHEFDHVRGIVLNDEQQAAYDAVMSSSGITVISGVGGSGKSLLIQRLTHDLRQQGKNVELAATTECASANTS